MNARTKLAMPAFLAAILVIAASSVWWYTNRTPRAVGMNAATQDLTGSTEPFEKNEHPTLTREDQSRIRQVEERRALSGPEATSDAADIFNSAETSLARRFSTLAHRAELGDRNAKHLAFQLSLRCRSDLTGVLPLGSWRDIRVQTLTSMRDECAAVFADPKYATYEKIDGPRDVFDKDVPYRIKLAFANGGTEAAVAVALSAIAARPDIWNTGVVSDTLQELGVSTIFTQPLVTGSIASLVPAKRAQLMEATLMLVACKHGAACDAGSDRMRYLCVMVGYCIPGATLMQLYRIEMFSGMEIRNIEILLDMLSQIAPATIDWAAGQGSMKS